MSGPNDQLQRAILPIPDIRPVSTTTFDAKVADQMTEFGSP